MVITLPTFFSGEAALVNTLLETGVDIVHLRKPQGTEEQCARLIEDIMADCRSRGINPRERLSHIVLHDHHALCLRYRLQGVHLNSRNPAPPRAIAEDRSRYTVSASCHSVDEARRRKADMDYVFLSPIYDSISKEGYRAAFSPQQLREAASGGIIDRKVIALGGVTLAHIDELHGLGFGGVALLGDVWRLKDDAEALREHIAKLRQALA